LFAFRAWDPHRVTAAPNRRASSSTDNAWVTPFLTPNTDPFARPTKPALNGFTVAVIVVPSADEPPMSSNVGSLPVDQDIFTGWPSPLKRHPHRHVGPRSPSRSARGGRFSTPL
jgi:hypothetical protein